MKNKLLAFIVAGLAVPAAEAVPVTDTLRVDDIVVTEVREALARGGSPYNVSVVGRREIEAAGRSSVLPVLSDRIPGLFLSERGTVGYGIYTGSAGALTLRGVGGSPTTGVLIAVDGRPQYMGVNGHPIADSYPAADVERVEVVKGPASTVYGSNALGGVINLITRGGGRDGVRTVLEAAYGSFGTQRYLLTNRVKKGRFSSFFSVGHDRTKGERRYSDFRGTHGFLKLGYGLSSHWKMDADVALNGFRSLDPGTVTAPSATDTLYAKVFRAGVSFSAQNRYDRTDGAVTVSYHYGDHKLYYGWRSDDCNAGVQAFQHFRFFRGPVWTVGFDYRHYGGRTRDVYGKLKLPAGRKTIDETAGYVTVRQGLAGERLFLSAGIRLDHNSAYGTEWVPEGGVAWHPDTLTVLRASVSKGFRSPTIKELYYFPPANDSLRPERVVGAELSGVRCLWGGRLKAEAALFWLRGTNAIQTEVTPLGPKNLNSGHFINKGFELALDWTVSRSFRANANYAYLHSDACLLNAPRHTLFAQGSWTGWKGRLDAAVNVKYVGRLYTSVAKGAVQREDFTLLNLLVHYRPAHFLEIYAQGNNLLDTDYEYTRGYPLPGTTLLVGLKCFF